MHWQIQGVLPVRAPPQQDPILSFSHTFCQKAPTLEVSTPPMARHPPTGNPGSATAMSPPSPTFEILDASLVDFYLISMVTGTVLWCYFWCESRRTPFLCNSSMSVLFSNILASTVEKWMHRRRSHWTAAGSDNICTFNYPWSNTEGLQNLTHPPTSYLSYPLIHRVENQLHKEKRKDQKNYFINHKCCI